MTTTEILKDIPMNELPSWFNDDLFNDCIKSDYPTNPNLRSKIITVKLAVPPGENYASTIYRVKIEVNDGIDIKIKSFIVKSLIEWNDETVEEVDVYDKEAFVYTDILPEFEKYYHEIGEKIEFGAKFYKGLGKSKKSYILEDLNERHFFMENRHVGLDLEHSKLFYKKLAKFHSASIIYHERHGEYNPDMFFSIYSEKAGVIMKQITDGMFPHFVEAIQKNEKLCHLVDKVKKWMPIYFEEMCRLVKPDPNGFNVLCHGEIWINNSMFSKDEKNNPTDVLFVDYQICNWTSPAYDLYYIFASSVHPDIKATEFDNLISIYHTELVSCLKELKYSGKIITLPELYDDLLKRRLYAVIFAISLGVMTLEGGDDSNLVNLVGQDEAAIKFKRSIFQSTKYYKQLEALYLFLDNRGLLDIN